MPAPHIHHAHEHADHHGAGAHRHAPASFDRAFALGVVLNTGFVIVEVIYGVAADSLALVADAAHNFGDVLGLLLAWAAIGLSRRLPTRTRTYGYGRSSILASLANAVLLLIGVGGIAVEAIRRIGAPEPVASTTVLWVAALGILVNGVTALMFAGGRKGDLNIRGAFLHMAADAAVSLGVVFAALLIGLTGWHWLDPAAGLVIALVITAGSWNLLRASLNLAMDAVPDAIDQQAVEEYLRGLAGVVEVHDLHIWALSTTDTALTVHLVRPAGTLDDALLAHTVEALRARFGIAHATIQIESGEGAAVCPLAPSSVI